MALRFISTERARLTAAVRLCGRVAPQRPTTAMRREYNQQAETTIPEEPILEHMKEASETGCLPENKRINQRLSEPRKPREESDREANAFLTSDLRVVKLCKHPRPDDS
ncbi:TPA: hypothetical protein DEB00_02410 [Candidatus Uhrbacteria bacterium]|nr:hypothetical protein [Candidatus Uhrbacteria bacterium]